LELVIATPSSTQRVNYLADAHHGGGKHLVVQADEKLTAFVEFESGRGSLAVPG
jgi:hypothetical protein